MKVNRTQLEEHRAEWREIARARGWDHEPFGVQVWTDPEGNIVDSVSTRELTVDVVNGVTLSTILPVGE